MTTPEIVWYVPSSPEREKWMDYLASRGWWGAFGTQTDLPQLWADYQETLDGVNA